MMLFGIREMTC